jgi:anti-sigma factor RsiW
MTEDEVRLLLRELRDEPVPADSLARVRLAVAERSRKGTWLGKRWRLLGVLAATAMIMLIALWVRPFRQLSTPDIALVPAPPPLAISRPTVKAPMSVASKPKKENRRKAAPTGGGVLVRIETADPDVVILLVGD